MKKNKVPNYFLCVILFFIIIFLTFYTIFYNNNINDIINNMKKIQLKFILMCILLFCTYFILQGLYMKRNLKIFNEKISLIKGIFYSIVEFFFSGITPSSTGGQPIQLYYMNKDHILKKKALITLTINTIYFKLVLVLLSTIIFIFHHNLVLDVSPLFIFFYFLGMATDVVMIILGYLVLYKPNKAKKLLMKAEKIIKKFRKNYEMNIDENLADYTNEVSCLKKHKVELIFEFIITMLQRLCLFSISYVVYKSFGLSEYNYFQLVIIQITITTALEFIPLPGGTGVSEYLFNLFFITAFGSVLAPTAMIVTRTFTFYIPLIVCGLVVLIKFIKDTQEDIGEQNKNVNE